LKYVENRMKLQRGFTLIEIMIVVVIIAILSAVAVPSYRDYVIRGQLVEGTSALAEGRIRLEQFFQDNRAYDAAGSPCPANTALFTYNCATAPTTYTLTATGIAGLAGFVYSINQANAKTSTTPVSGGPVNCWIMKRASSC
jgi:type IV pilus assembly protein PilE